MSNEIERRFLVTSYHLAVIRDDEVSPNYAHKLWINALGGEVLSIFEIEQIYLSIQRDTSGNIEYEERIRRQTELYDDGSRGESDYVYAKKEGRGIHRQEKPFKVSAGDYQKVKSNNALLKLQKIRTYFKYDGHEFSLDRYLGPLGGLCLAEIEFDDLCGAVNFEPERYRHFLAQEVSFSNADLAEAQKIPEDLTLPRHLGDSGDLAS